MMALGLLLRATSGVVPWTLCTSSSPTIPRMPTATAAAATTDCMTRCTLGADNVHLKRTSRSRFRGIVLPQLFPRHMLGSARRHGSCGCYRAGAGHARGLPVKQLLGCSYLAAKLQPTEQTSTYWPQPGQTAPQMSARKSGEPLTSHIGYGPKAEEDLSS